MRVLDGRRDHMIRRVDVENSEHYVTASESIIQHSKTYQCGKSSSHVSLNCFRLLRAITPVASFRLPTTSSCLIAANTSTRPTTMYILNSDNIVKLAFSLPIIPILFVIAWKLGIFNWSLFPVDPSKQAYDPKTGLGRGVSQVAYVANYKI